MIQMKAFDESIGGWVEAGEGIKEVDFKKHIKAISVRLAMMRYGGKTAIRANGMAMLKREDKTQTKAKNGTKQMATLYFNTTRQTDRKTDRATDRQAGRKTDRHTDRQAYRQTSRQTDRLTD